MDNTMIAKGIKYLASIDPDIQDAVELIGAPAPRIRPHGIEALVSIIISQQLSTEAAASIMAKVKNLLPDISANSILKTPPEQLRAAGLSRRKIEYVCALAEAIKTNRLDLEALKQMPDSEAINHITQLRGMGRWSAEIYLMFSLQRQDIFPADDLAIVIALQKLKGLEERPSAKEARVITEHWSPWLSVGSLFLWHYYRGAP
ncbi:DNA-3-methyladenine glycosylase family protein [Neptuniibacter caesariensis]|uniref:DNA-3-methyladenine glycosylase II n=1 Tax=Neptuniibacter caesariensis TaxID=207954 RepID=A0A7U8GTK5_NEPCE|nr:DNA-3-methyladenine glycosylase [Neptuniibacter caesariensis]EAR62392.1 DNA-3-methyladenine glycosylase II, putative [Oceanospirillum sp. MED92] [Neptuniibacter caesariensis]